MLKPAVLMALVGVAAAGCSVRSERVVEVPAATTTTQRTTTTSNNPYQAPTTTTTTYTTPAR